MTAGALIDGRTQARLDALLDERSATLARRGRSGTRVATRPVLLCLCGPDRYGLPLGEVAQVMPARACTPVPGAPAAVLGLVALSGRVVSVIGLAEALGRPAEGLGRHAGMTDNAGWETDGEVPTGHFVLLRGTGAAIALAVDRVEAVIAIPVEAAPAGGEAPAGLREASLGSGAVSVYQAGGSHPGAVVVIDPRLLIHRYLS
ncbi:hypothetical protein ASG40_15785 [Methylobacterium sp. Leaf399]|uniref:chemotaxis protein CheW n=1 Tax=Methylobacterium sp. Leaf399 TaxID=1736364 RepID=UPI0006F449AD|nr:chemotaxis protein CheW [Methylobacterium sp. Leaf399]KQT19114.1 hypothetical protein ASG40_15785 [Methylobacterium sp. Leaf399]